MGTNNIFKTLSYDCDGYCQNFISAIFCNSCNGMTAGLVKTVITYFLFKYLKLLSIFLLYSTRISYNNVFRL